MTMDKPIDEKHTAGLCPSCGGDVRVYVRGTSLRILAHKREEFDRRAARTGRMVPCRTDLTAGGEALRRLSVNLQASVKSAQSGLDRATEARDAHRAAVVMAFARAGLEVCDE
jgi:hypothetical protein